VPVRRVQQVAVRVNGVQPGQWIAQPLSCQQPVACGDLRGRVVGQISVAGPPGDGSRPVTRR
jgi:hypothetical protein